MLEIEILAGITKHRKIFFQEVADKGHAEKVFRRPLITRTRCLLAHRRPVAGGIIIPPQPCQCHEIDLLVDPFDDTGEVTS